LEITSKLYFVQRNKAFIIGGMKKSDKERKRNLPVVLIKNSFHLPLFKKENKS